MLAGVVVASRRALRLALAAASFVACQGGDDDSAKHQSPDAAGESSGATAGRASTGGGSAQAGTGGTTTGDAGTGAVSRGGSSRGGAGSTTTGGSSGNDEGGTPGDAGGAGGVGDDPPPPLPPELTWTLEGSPVIVNGVWGSHPDDVYAVGYPGTTIAHYVGGQWDQERTSYTGEIFSVWGSGTGDVYATGENGTVFHSSGAGSWLFHEDPFLATPFSQVFGFDSRSVYLMGGGIRHGWYNHFGDAEAVSGLRMWGSSPADLYVAHATAFGDNVFHSTGDGNWTGQAQTGEAMGAIWGVHAKLVYATGEEHVFVSRGDGQWTADLTLPSGDTAKTVWAAGGLAYVGTKKGTFYVSNGPGSWSPGQVVNRDDAALDIRGIWAASSTNVYLATGRGIYHGVAGDGGSGGAGAGGSGGAAGGMGGGGTGGGDYSTDRDEFFGEPRCGSSLDLCDDFESGAIDADVWYAMGTVTVDDLHAARGTYAAHFRTLGDTAPSYIEQTTSFPAPYDTYWGRMFVYFESLPTSPQFVHWSLTTAGNGLSGSEETHLGGQFDGTLSRFLVSNAPLENYFTLPDDDLPGAPRAVPEGEWICLEWLNDGLADETRFFWDGVEHPSMHTTPTVHGQSTDDYLLPEFERAWVGFWVYQSDPMPAETDVWIDEVAFHRERIGCSR